MHHNCLPTNTWKQNKKLISTDKCPVCQLPETLNHAFLQCEHTKKVWEFLEKFNNIQKPCNENELKWLHNIHNKEVPSTVCEWEDIAREFDEMWQFPHCLGAIDGKHVQIICPKQSGSAYYNYKGIYSVVMMAIVRADLSFIYVDAGTNGRQSDSSIWNASNLKKAIDDGKLNFPPDSPLQSGGQPIPYVFVTDEGIGMSSRVMRPYPMKQLTAEKSIFNYRLSRARRVVENAFGVLSSVWRVFSTVILLSPDKAAKIILTCCVLHNMLRERKIKSYLTATTSANFEEQHQQFTPLENSRNLNPSTTAAKAIRDELKTYFNTVGQVEWQ
ncbi:protein ALP1-like [Centruroides sculpturatus]|uniref:protein ALP1-like n=1 Tax=Centruroides sculpturatus TaxID=218467 RepID=UPI000C6D1857|nr:protein ALP1-like [Centruroides sculpturatus]